MGARWSETVSVYGPTTLTTLLPVALAGAHPLLALLLVRIAWLAPLAVVMELSFRQLRDRPLFHAMLWQSPLFLLEGPGQLHPDVLGVAAITAGVLLHRQGRLKSAWVALTVAVLAKYTFAIGAVWFWLAGTRTTRERLRRLPGMAAIAAAVSAVEFAPYWHGVETITTPLRTLARMNPGGSLTEVAGIVVHWVRGGSFVAEDSTMTSALAFDHAAHAGTWLVASFVLGLLVLRIAASVFPAMLARASDEDVALGTGVLLVAVTTLLSRRFEPWYLLAALPFFALRCTSEWRRWWIAATAATVAPTFMNVLPKDAPILPVWSVVATISVVGVFLFSFRARYLAFGADEREREMSLVSEGFGPLID
jgi:hypothetical protein